MDRRVVLEVKVLKVIQVKQDKLTQLEGREELVDVGPKEKRGSPWRTLQRRLLPMPQNQLLPKRKIM